MEKSIHLSIPKPCAEKWETFAPVATGGFCSTCSKVVIDFTSLSDHEIVNFFTNKPAHACGRFRQDQLRSYVHTPAPVIHPGITLFKTGLLSLLLFLINKPLLAQPISDKPKTEIIDQQVLPIEKLQVIDEERIFKGVVISAEDNSTLPGVNVVLKGSTVGTTTDADGRFEFPQKLKEGDILVFSFIGLETMEYIVRKEDKDTVEIKMIMMYVAMMGEIVVGQVYVPQESVFRKLWWKVKTLF